VVSPSANSSNHKGSERKAEIVLISLATTSDSTLWMLRMLRSEVLHYAAYDAHLANYTLYNRLLHNMICCHNTLFTKMN